MNYRPLSFPIFLVSYTLLMACLAWFDRVTKLYALQLKQTVIINSFLQFTLHINRGISFSMLHFANQLGYWCVTIVILCVASYLTYYAFQRHSLGKSTYGESLMLVGAYSNLFDRFFYNGVIDFIAVSIAGYHFPVFNIADSFIVIGVLIIGITTWREL